MKRVSRLALPLLGALALTAIGRAQDATTDRRTSTPPTTTSTPTTTTPTTSATATETPRFSTFDSASPTVRTAVSNAQAIAESIRAAGPTATTTADPVLSRAVSQATVAIVQDGRVARSNILAERQAALTRLRLAQSEAERRRLIDELRVTSGRRMEEQREVARLVRDRLRELRATTTITPRTGN